MYEYTYIYIYIYVFQSLIKVIAASKNIQYLFSFYTDKTHVHSSSVLFLTDTLMHLSFLLKLSMNSEISRWCRFQLELFSRIHHKISYALLWSFIYLWTSLRIWWIEFLNFVHEDQSGPHLRLLYIRAGHLLTLIK